MGIENLGKITICRNINERDLGDEIIVLRTGFDELHSFRDTGLEIWSMLKEGKRTEDILHRIATDYKIDNKEAEADLMDFLEECKLKGLINY